MYSTFISVKAINRLNFNFNKLLEIKNKSIVSQIKTHANISMHSIRMGLKPSSSPNIINARPSMPIIIIITEETVLRLRLRAFSIKWRLVTDTEKESDTEKEHTQHNFVPNGANKKCTVCQKEFEYTEEENFNDWMNGIKDSKSDEYCYSLF